MHSHKKLFCVFTFNFQLLVRTVLTNPCAPWFEWVLKNINHSTSWKSTNMAIRLMKLCKPMPRRRGGMTQWIKTVNLLEPFTHYGDIFIWLKIQTTIVKITTLRKKINEFCFYLMHVWCDEKYFEKCNEVLVKGLKSKSVAICIFNNPYIYHHLFLHGTSVLRSYSNFIRNFNEFLGNCQISVTMMFGSRPHHSLLSFYRVNNWTIKQRRWCSKMGIFING